MGDETTASGPRRRTWELFLAGCWALLGAWTVAAGALWPGLAQLVLATSYLAFALSPRLASWADAPFRRKQTG